MSLLTFTSVMKVPKGQPLQLCLQERKSPASEANGRSPRHNAVDYGVVCKGGIALTLELLKTRGLEPEEVAMWVRKKLASPNYTLPLFLRDNNYRAFTLVIKINEDTGSVEILVGCAHPPLAKYLCKDCTEEIA